MDYDQPLYIKQRNKKSVYDWRLIKMLSISLSLKSIREMFPTFLTAFKIGVIRFALLFIPKQGMCG